MNNELKKIKIIIKEKIDQLTQQPNSFKSLHKLENKILPLIEELQTIEDIKPHTTNDEQILFNEQQKLIFQTLKSFLQSDFSDNIICEIRPGTGGGEASIFAKDLFNVYMKMCEYYDAKVEVIDYRGEHNSLQLVCFKVTGKQIEKHFQHESGIHRVQRVPITEAKGRIHTSTASVSILPDVSRIEININPKDLHTETCRASGAGGQHVNKTESAVRIVHIPTGLAVECQEERSQLSNKDKAIKLLKIRLYEREIQIRKKERDAARNTQIGSATRSEKSRTYNYHDNRITDHERGFNFFNLDKIMSGNLQVFIGKLEEHIEQTYNLLNELMEYIDSL